MKNALKWTPLAVAMALGFFAATPTQAQERGNAYGHRDDDRGRGRGDDNDQERRYYGDRDDRRERNDDRDRRYHRNGHWDNGRRGSPPWARGRDYRSYRYSNVYVVPAGYYRTYGLYAPRPGYRWVRDDAGHYMLVAIASGIISDILFRHGL